MSSNTFPIHPSITSLHKVLITMYRQPLYYQPPRSLSLPDPFQYHDFSSVAGHGYNEPYWEDMSFTDDSLDTPTLTDEPLVSDMSDWVEYGDDIIDAGPASFPADEFCPSQQDLLTAQAMVQTVNPLDLLLNRPVLAEKMHMGSDTFVVGEATLSPQDNTMDSSFGFYNKMQLGFSSFQSAPYFAPLQQQVSFISQHALCERGKIDQTADLPSIDLPTSLTVSPDEPTGKVTLVDDDGEEYDAWYFETILDARQVARCKGGTEYLVQYTGYSPSWQPARDLQENLDEIMDFHNRMPGKPGPPKWVLAALAQ